MPAEKNPAGVTALQTFRGTLRVSQFGFHPLQLSPVNRQDSRHREIHNELRWRGKQTDPNRNDCFPLGCLHAILLENVGDEAFMPVCGGISVDLLVIPHISGITVMGNPV